MVQRDLMKLNLADRMHAVILLMRPAWCSRAKLAYETGLVQPGETAP